jgi:hypothetical protein
MQVNKKSTNFPIWLAVITTGITIAIGVPMIIGWNPIAAITSLASSEGKKTPRKLLPFTDSNSNKVGFIDREGNVIIQPQFEGVDFSSEFSEGLLAVKNGNKYGYIDESGKIAINPQFDEAYGFSDGLAAVKIGKKYGFIDKTGKIVINPQFEGSYPFPYPLPFIEGLSSISIDGKSGAIDKTGKLVVNNQFESPIIFLEDLAPAKVDKKFGYIDKTGKIVVNPQFDEANNFTDGLAGVRIDGKWGYIDKTGKTVINPQFDEARGFIDGLAPVKIDKYYGFIDKTGKIVINPQFDNVNFLDNGSIGLNSGIKKGIAASNPFKEGLASVKIDGKYGFIDKTGKIVINPQFNEAQGFHEGLAAVRIGEQWGFIDKNSKIIITPQFSFATPFRDGISITSIESKKDIKTGYINQKGEYIWSVSDVSNSRKKFQFEARQNINLVNKSQTSIRATNPGFAASFNGLATGTLKGEDRDRTSNYEYKISLQSSDFAIIGAKPVDSGIKGYIGATRKYTNAANQSTISSIMCQSDAAGGDGTDIANAPVAGSTDPLKCAPGWTKLD